MLVFNSLVRCFLTDHSPFATMLTRLPLPSQKIRAGSGNVRSQ